MSKDQGNRRYRLLKDLPDVKAGTELEANDNGFVKTPETVYDPNMYPDWFAPLPMDTEAEGRWIAQEGDHYWFVTAVCTPDEALNSGNWYSAELGTAGNMFRTEAQAQAAAEAIRSVLEAIQAPEFEGTDLGNDVLDKVKAARAAVQTQGAGE